MAKKDDLRLQRTNTIINLRSKAQEKALERALVTVVARLTEKFPGIALDHVAEWKLKDVVERLSAAFPKVDFHHHFASSAMRPDGGILSLVDKAGKRHAVLIAEKKNQGTNDLRLSEGKRKQAKGNAIERLVKNVIGFRTAFEDGGHLPVRLLRRRMRLRR